MLVLYLNYSLLPAYFPILRGLRKDKYNRSISKYHVDVDEDDDEVSEDLEREVKVSCKAGKHVSCLGRIPLQCLSSSIDLYLWGLECLVVLMFPSI